MTRMPDVRWVSSMSEHLDHGHGLPNNDQAIMPPGWGAVRPLALRNGRTRSVPGLASYAALADDRLAKAISTLAWGDQ
jgi:hypothetical protein